MLQKMKRLNSDTPCPILKQCLDLEFEAFGYIKSTEKVLKGLLIGVIRIVATGVVGGIMYYKHIGNEMYLDTLITCTKYAGMGIATGMLDILTVVGQIYGSSRIRAKIYKDKPNTDGVLKFYREKNGFILSIDQTKYTKKPHVYITIEKRLKKRTRSFVQDEEKTCQFKLFLSRRTSV